MKVLIINSVCGIRSTGRICTDFASELEKRGHQVRIAYGRESVPEQFRKYAIRIGSEMDVKCHVIRSRLLDGEGTGSKRATEKFVQWMEEFNPDVIHLHNVHGYYINMEVLFKYLRISGKKIIWTLHDCWAFTGHSGTCDSVSCERWKTGCFQCPKTKGYPKSYIDRSESNWKRKKRLITEVSQINIVTPSYWLADLARQSFLSKFNIQTIHNGIDIKQFYPLENDFRKKYSIDDKFVILGVASLWGKGLNDFIELSKKLGNQYRVVLVGLTRAQLQNIPDTIIGIERTESVKELAQIYSMADVFLNLTDCDALSTVDVEAMFCDTPVITYKVSKSAENIIEECSFIVEQGNLEAVMEKIEICRKNPKKFRGTKKIFPKNNFDKASAMRKYLKIYKMAQTVKGGYYEIREKYNVQGKIVILGVAAFWSSIKGLPDMIKLHNLLVETGKSDKYQIILVGLSVDQIRRLPDGIIGFTRTNSVEELRQLYSMADIFINPTEHDNYPTVNLESIACGTPVISYNTGGSVESAIFYGKVCRRNTPEELLACINDLNNINLASDIYSCVSADTAIEKYMELLVQYG